MTVEKQPLAALDKQEAGYQVKISAFGTLKGSLASLQTAVKKLEDPSTLSSLKATPGDSTIFTASANASASMSTDSVEVRHLAAAQKIDSVGFQSAGATVGSGSLTIQFGTYD